MILVKLNIWLLEYFAFGKEEKVFTFKGNGSMDGKQKIMLVLILRWDGRRTLTDIWTFKKLQNTFSCRSVCDGEVCCCVHNIIFNKNVNYSFIQETSLKKYVYWVIYFILIKRTPKHRIRGKQKINFSFNIR